MSAGLGPRPQRDAHLEARALLALYATSYVFRQPIEELAALTRRSPDVAFARQVAMYLAHVAFGMSLNQVAHVFRRDRTTVAHACQLVEDRRDDPDLDDLLEDLETFLRAAPEPRAHSATLEPAP